MAISKELLEQLAVAVNKKDIRTAGRLLIGYKGKFAEYGFFHIACAEGLPEATQLFLTIDKLNINLQKGKTNKTALMLAAEQGQLEIVKLLLKRPDINVNLTDSNGATALDLATKAGHSAIASELINHGAKAGKENISDNAKAQQDAFNRMQANNRAVLVNNNQPDAYAKIRTGQMSKEEAEARLRQLETECEQIKNHYSNQRQKYIEELQTNLSNALAHQIPSYST